MSENTKFIATLIIGIIGASAWFAPLIYKHVSRNKFHGKIISIYSNFNEDRSKILLLFKISVVSKNKDFFLKDVDSRIKFQSSSYINGSASNNRIVVFTFENKPKKLLVPGNEFINNMSVLKKDAAVVGYLMYIIDYSKDEDIDEIEFIFKSYKRKRRKTLKFKRSEDIIREKLFHDNSIWGDINMNDPEIVALEQKSIYK